MKIATTPHKHAAIIKAWADGEKVQWREHYPETGYTEWKEIAFPGFYADEHFEYRIKPDEVEVTDGFLMYCAWRSIRPGPGSNEFAWSHEQSTIKANFEVYAKKFLELKNAQNR